MQLLSRQSIYVSSLLLIVIPCFFLWACRQPIKPVDKWQAKMLEAHGGRDALARVATILYSGRIATRGDRGTVDLIVSRPGKLRTSMKYLKRYEDRILLEKRGWRNVGTGFEEASGASLNAMIFQYNHLSLPMGIINGKYNISYTELELAGKTLPAFELTGEQEPAMTVIIDPGTGLIQRIDGRITMGAREIVMGVDYSDYRKVSGFMLPHRIVNYVNGNAVAESLYDKVAVNVALDPNVFSVNQPATLK